MASDIAGEPMPDRRRVSPVVQFIRQIRWKLFPAPHPLRKILSVSSPPT